MGVDTLLIVHPLQPIELLDELRSVFPTVHYYPGLEGNDYSGAEATLPPPEVYAETEAIFLFNLPKNLVSFDQTPKLKLIQVVGAGAAQITGSEFYKSVPEESELILANASGIHVPQIGEHVLMTVMALNHKLIHISEKSKAEQRWLGPKELGGMFVQELRGQTFGIVGYGHLGRHVARLATAFGANILACTRSGKKASIGGYILSGTGDKDGELPLEWYKTEKSDLLAMLAKCDVVVNCLPSSKDTYRLLGKDEFVAMKDTAILVNIGRGDTMDQEALVEALQASGEKSGVPGTFQIGGAAIDVTDPEPLPDGHPLFTLPNCILTPHCSWASKVNFVRAVEILVLNKKRLDEGNGALNAMRGKGESH